MTSTIWFLVMRMGGCGRWDRLEGQDLSRPEENISNEPIFSLFVQNSSYRRTTSCLFFGDGETFFINWTRFSIDRSPVLQAAGPRILPIYAQTARLGWVAFIRKFRDKISSPFKEPPASSFFPAVEGGDWTPRDCAKPANTLFKDERRAVGRPLGTRPAQLRTVNVAPRAGDFVPSAYKIHTFSRGCDLPPHPDPAFKDQDQRKMGFTYIFCARPKTP